MSDFIKKQKELYKSLKSCFCEILNQEVFCNANGLNHILYYKRRPRKFSERYYRAGLISYVKEVIENSKKISEEIKSETPLIVTWSLIHEIIDENNQKQKIKVILIKKGNGRIYFLSVMRIKKSKNKS